MHTQPKDSGTFHWVCIYTVFVAICALVLISPDHILQNIKMSFLNMPVFIANLCHFSMAFEVLSVC